MLLHAVHPFIFKLSATVLKKNLNLKEILMNL